MNSVPEILLVDDNPADVGLVSDALADSARTPHVHAVIDGDIRNGHDDPQNFELDAFAQALEGILERLSGRESGSDTGPDIVGAVRSPAPAQGAE